MRLVHENSETDLAKKRAQDEIVWPLRELAANIMRVSRGAGRPHEIASQCTAVLQAFQVYREILGEWPSSYDVAVAIDQNSLDRGRQDFSDLDYGFQTIMRGGLQLAASRLLFQSTHEAAGEREIMEGVRMREAAIERSRQAFAMQKRKKPSGVKKRAIARSEEWKE